MSGKKAVLLVFIAGTLVVVGLIATAWYLRKNPPRRKLVQAQQTSGQALPLLLVPHRTHLFGSVHGLLLVRG